MNNKILKNLFLIISAFIFSFLFFACSKDEDDGIFYLSVLAEVKNQRVNVRINAVDTKDEVVEVEIDWGNGEKEKINSNFDSIIKQYEYTDLGIYEISVEAKNNKNKNIKEIRTVEIKTMNQLPQINIEESVTNQRVVLNGNIIDTDNEIKQVSINWGDNSDDLILSENLENLSLIHNYSSIGNYTVTIFVEDETNEGVVKEINVNITKNQPAIIEVEHSVSKEKIILSGKIIDLDSDIEYLRIDWGDGSGYKFIKSNFDNINLENIYTVTGKYNINLSVKDVFGAITEKSFNEIEVHVNQKPETDINIETIHNKIQISGKAEDKDGYIQKITIDFGNEAIKDYILEDYTNIDIEYTYEIEGDYTVKIDVYDNEEGLSSYTKTVSIKNETPKMELNKTTDEYTLILEGSIKMDTADIMLVYVDWGNGNQEVIKDGFETIKLTHTYVYSGIYNLTFVIKDSNEKMYEKEFSIEIFGEGIHFEDKKFESYIRELTGISTSYITKEDVENITYININNKNIDSIKGIEKFNNLETFIAKNNNLSDLYDLSNLVKLKKIDIETNNITNTSFIKDLINLESIVLKGNPITDISDIENCKSIEILDIGFTLLKPEDIEILKELPKLSVLNLGYLKLTNEDIKLIGELNNLTWLELGNNNITEINNLLNLSNLKWLGLKNNQIENIYEIKVLTALESLNIAENSIQNIDVLLEMTNLTEVDVRDNNLDTNGRNIINELIAKGCTVEYDYYKDMALVEAGSFVMGDVWGDENAGDDELPTHTVEITNDFYIGKYEVTNKQFMEFLADKNITTGKYNNNDVYDLDDTDGVIKYDTQLQKFYIIEGKEYYPVSELTWWGAIYYCNWLSEKEGLKPVYNESGGDIIDENGSITAYVDKVKGYRLPTEAEWEYAARGGKNSKGYKYSGGENPSEYAWYGANSEGKAHEIGKKKPNELGIYDMSGNVWEWCTDWTGRIYTEEKLTNPYNYKKPDNMSEDTLVSYRTRRGGAYRLYAEEHNATGESSDTTGASDIRVSNRIKLIPKSKDSQGKSRPDTGFRIVRNSN